MLIGLQYHRLFLVCFPIWICHRDEICSYVWKKKPFTLNEINGFGRVTSSYFDGTVRMYCCVEMLGCSGCVICSSPDSSKGLRYNLKKFFCFSHPVGTSSPFGFGAPCKETVFFALFFRPCSSFGSVLLQHSF